MAIQAARNIGELTLNKIVQYGNLNIIGSNTCTISNENFTACLVILNFRAPVRPRAAQPLAKISRLPRP